METKEINANLILPQKKEIRGLKENEDLTSIIEQETFEVFEIPSELKDKVEADYFLRYNDNDSRYLMEFKAENVDIKIQIQDPCRFNQDYEHGLKEVIKKYDLNPTQEYNSINNFKY